MPPAAEDRETALEFLITKIVDEEIYNDQLPQYCVQWYGYGHAEDTWESVPHLPKSSIFRYRSLRSLLLPPEKLLS